MTLDELHAVFFCVTFAVLMEFNGSRGIRNLESCTVWQTATFWI